MQALLVILGFFFAELFVLIELGAVTSAWTIIFYCLALMFVATWVARLAQLDAQRVLAESEQGARRFGLFVMPPLTRRGPLAPFALWMMAAIMFAFPGVISDGVGVVLFVMGLVQRLRRDRPARPSRTTRGPTVEVEVLPPGQVRSPFQKRPKIIDVE